MVGKSPIEEILALLSNAADAAEVALLPCLQACAKNTLLASRQLNLGLHSAAPRRATLRQSNSLPPIPRARSPPNGDLSATEKAGPALLRVPPYPYPCHSTRRCVLLLFLEKFSSNARSVDSQALFFAERVSHPLLRQICAFSSSKNLGRQLTYALCSRFRGQGRPSPVKRPQPAGIRLVPSIHMPRDPLPAADFLHRCSRIVEGWVSRAGVIPSPWLIHSLAGSRSVWPLLAIYGASSATTTLACIATVLTMPGIEAQLPQLLGSYVPFLLVPAAMAGVFGTRLTRLAVVSEVRTKTE